MRSTAIGIAAAFLLSVVLYAQSSSGNLRGIVQDSSRARLAGAIIEVDRPASSLIRRANADTQGEFRIEDLTPGLWHMRVSASGFQTAVADIAVLVSATRDITVELLPSHVSETVGVTAVSSSITSQPIDLSSNVHQAVATTQDLEGLPLPARSFANIAYLAPGTEPVEPSDPTKARITAVSTGGSS